jgi:hypothetical protein
MNFLNHLENWLEEANERSSSIVTAKTAEIEKELELRLHLHEPRMKRAEMDVHNVRACKYTLNQDCSIDCIVFFLCFWFNQPKSL